MRTAPILIFSAAMAAAGCDSKEEKPVGIGGATPSTAVQAPPQGNSELVASPAFRAMPIGGSFQAKLESTAVIPMEPSKKLRKKMGQFRAIDFETKMTATFGAERMSTKDDEATDRWKIAYETFEQTKTGAGSEKSMTDLELPDRTLVASIYEQNTTVLGEQGESATDSQTELTSAIAADLSRWDRWGKFFSDRDFPQGNIIEGPENLPFGSIAEATFGPIVEANTTVGMFRFALVDQNEVAIFEIHSQMKAEEQRGNTTVYWDIQQKGRMTVRIVDGFLLAYDLEAKAVPREKTGAMLPSGSGTWKIGYSVSPASISFGD